MLVAGAPACSEVFSARVWIPQKSFKNYHSYLELSCSSCVWDILLITPFFIFPLSHLTILKSLFYLLKCYKIKNKSDIVTARNKIYKIENFGVEAAVFFILMLQRCSSHFPLDTISMQYSELKCKIPSTNKDIRNWLGQQTRVF